MWIFASSHGTNFPFIQIFSDFGKLMLGSSPRKTAHSSKRARARATEVLDLQGFRPETA
jgi:hypothetical protein